MQGLRPNVFLRRMVAGATAGTAETYQATGIAALATLARRREGLDQRYGNNDGLERQENQCPNHAASMSTSNRVTKDYLELPILCLCAVAHIHAAMAVTLGVLAAAATAPPRSPSARIANDRPNTHFGSCARPLSPILVFAFAWAASFPSAPFRRAARGIGRFDRRLRWRRRHRKALAASQELEERQTRRRRRRGGR
jgi:hypothetical protein